MPHLSLLYGDFPRETKRSIIAALGDELAASFEVNKLHLFSTEGEAEDWFIVETFPIK